MRGDPGADRGLCCQDCWYSSSARSDRTEKDSSPSLCSGQDRTSAARLGPHRAVRGVASNPRSRRLPRLTIAAAAAASVGAPLPSGHESCRSATRTGAVGPAQLANDAPSAPQQRHPDPSPFAGNPVGPFRAARVARTPATHCRHAETTCLGSRSSAPPPAALGTRPGCRSLRYLAYLYRMSHHLPTRKSCKCHILFPE